MLNNRIMAPRRFATQDHDISRLKTVAKAGEGSLNDVFLTIVGGALRRYLLEIGALPRQSLTVNVPVSVRAEGEAGVGNALTFVYATSARTSTTRWRGSGWSGSGRRRRRRGCRTRARG
jgi:hypothetical protein